MNENSEPRPGKHAVADLEDTQRRKTAVPTKSKQTDLVFKTLCHHFFADLVEIAEPKFARRVDLTNIEFLEQEAFSDYPEGTQHIADLVVRLTSRDGEGRIVLVQTEVEDKFRTAIDERNFYYYLYLRGKYRVPVLLITIFLQGGKPEDGKGQGGGLTTREYLDEAEGFESCRFRYVALFLRQSRAEDFVDRPEPLAPALAAVMKSDWGPAEKRLRCMRAIRRADIDDARRFLLVKLVDLYVELDEVQAELYSAAISKEGNEEVREMVITWEETLADREAKGEAKGLAAMRNSILRVLKHQLKSVPDFVRQKLDAIQSIERLEEILDQALTVNSVDELVLSG